jgi:hypothetical protein
MPGTLITQRSKVQILPAALFLTAVLVGAGDRPQYELARVAQRIVMWYSARMWTLWLLPLILPFVVLVSGCATLLRSWKHGAEVPPFVAGTTLASAGTEPDGSLY